MPSDKKSLRMGHTQNPKPPSILQVSECQVWLQSRGWPTTTQRPNPAPACFSEVSLNTAKLLHCILTMAAFTLQRQSWVVTVTLWPAKPKALTIWPLAESLQTTVMESTNPVRTSALPLFLAVPHSTWDISSPTSDQTHAPCIRSSES